jgi:plastocyanin
MIGRRAAAALVVGAVALLGACGGDDGDDGATATTAPPASGATTTAAPASSTAPPSTVSPTSTTGAAVDADAELVVEDYTFAALTVPPGSVVHLDNKDAEPHTVSSTDGAFRFDPATETFVAPSAPGSYSYVCGVHAFMEGTLTVA